VKLPAAKQALQQQQQQQLPVYLVQSPNPKGVDSDLV
jgi:hypothetical protein